MAGDTPKKEKKDKKRKSEAAEVDTAPPVAPEVVPPEEGTASAEAMVMEVDGQRAEKKAKKEKKEKAGRKSLGGADDGDEDKKVGFSSILRQCQSEQISG